MKPNIIPLDVHGITSDKISVEALNIIETLQKNKYQAFVVGGAVRDILLGLTPKDFDIVTDAKPEEITPLFRRAKIIGRRFKLVHIYDDNYNDFFEVSTFRRLARNNKDVDAHGRVLSDNEYGSKEEDSHRRDFTINALYYDPMHQEIWDYHYGYLDIKDRILRIIGKSPENRYREDPVRMLRALRLAGKLDVSIEASTLAPISKLGGLLTNVPTARLFDEGLKVLSSGHSVNCVEYLKNHRLINVVFPMIHHAKSDHYTEGFIKKFLSYVDEQIKDGNYIPADFIMSGLLWHLTKDEWETLIENGIANQQAMQYACNHMIDKYFFRWSIPLKMADYIREVFETQPRFVLHDPNSHKISKARVNKMAKMTTYRSFRASLEFFNIRAGFGEVPQELATVWNDYRKASTAKRVEIQANILSGQIILAPVLAQDDTEEIVKTVAKKRRKRKNKKKNPVNTQLESSDNLE